MKLQQRLIDFLEWINKVSQEEPMKLETDNDDIAIMYMQQVEPKEDFANAIPRFESEYLVCPKCKTTLEFSNGHSSNPELQRDPYYGCRKCKFEIEIDIEASIKAKH